MNHVTHTRSIMLSFAASTGLSDLSREPRRYLWTDAFAVCNYLELFRQTGEQTFMQLALVLVDQVHQVLGRYRKNGLRNGWLSGLDEKQALLHPTRGGLRIGKKLDERDHGSAFDESLEWDQDGQYFHYLTRWMHALACVGHETGQDVYTRWALELAKVTHAAFTYTPSGTGRKRLYWKMSIDLSRPLVDSMGQHDPLDGLITYLQLDAGAKRLSSQQAELNLATETEDMLAMCNGQSWVSSDPLGIGGLLADACKLALLIDIHHIPEVARLEALLVDIDYSLRAFVSRNQLNLNANDRLAFRELGLAIGLHAIGKMQKRIAQHPENFINARQLPFLLSRLAGFQHIREIIEDFWLEPAHHVTSTWQDHEDINNVMLATSLVPDGYLRI